MCYGAYHQFATTGRMGAESQGATPPLEAKCLVGPAARERKITRHCLRLGGLLGAAGVRTSKPVCIQSVLSTSQMGVKSKDATKAFEVAIVTE